MNDARSTAPSGPTTPSPQRPRRILIHTAEPTRFPSRAPAVDLQALAQAVIGSASDLDADVEIVLGAETVPADLSVDAPLIRRLREALPRATITYRARAEGLDSAAFARLLDAGVTSLEIDVSTNEHARPRDAIDALLLQAGFPRDGRGIDDNARFGATLDSAIDDGRRRAGLRVTARGEGIPMSGFERWHPCRLPGEELALWSDGSAYPCGEQAAFLGDAPTANWRRDGILGSFASEAAAAQRIAHARPGVDLPLPCRSCPHPARPLDLALAERLDRFRDLHRGERCFVLGNGPSLAKLDLTLLTGETTFGVNRVHEAYERLGLAPVTYFCVSDPTIWRLLDRRADRARARASFVRTPDVPLAESGDALAVVQHDYDLLGEDGWFARDPRQGLARGKTVLLDLCLPLAYWMGFDEVILIGCDFDYDATRDNHFYPDRHEPWHFAGTRAVHAPPFAAQRRGMSTAAAAFAARGGRLVNATPGGGLDVLPRIDYDTLFQGSARRIHS